MSNRKSALGKGLGALIPGETTEDARAPDISRTRLYNFEDRVRAAGRITDVGLDLIDPNPYQPRTRFNEKELEELADSIRQVGIVQPITVRATDGGRYELISGERRHRAAQIAGLTAIPAYIREADSETMLEMALVENVQRQSLNPIEIALGYRRLIDECRLTQEDVAEKVGKSRTAVTNSLRLLKLPPAIQSALKDGTVSTGHARALLALVSEREQLGLLDTILKKGLSVRAVEEQVRKTLAGKKGEKKAPRPDARGRTEDPALRVVRDRIRDSLSTQVLIKPNKNRDGGRIEVEYYSDDDLERLVELISG